MMSDDLVEVTDLSGLRIEQRLIAYLMTADEAAQTTLLREVTDCRIF